MAIPTHIVAGDTVRWSEAPDVSAAAGPVTPATFDMTYHLRGQDTVASTDIVGSAEASHWTFALTTAQTAALNITTANVLWFWTLAATAQVDAARYTVDAGRLIVRPNLAALAASSYDGRTQAERDLVAVRAALSARASGGAPVEYSIGNRSLKREPLAALLSLETRLVMQVNRERAAQRIAKGLGNPSTVFVRFGSGGRRK